MSTTAQDDASRQPVTRGVPADPGLAPDGRRKTERVRFECEIGLQTDSNFFTGFTRNLSAGGLFVAAFDVPLPIGAEVDVTFSLPDGERIACRAKVRWIRELRDHTPDVWPGMGLEFLDLTGAATAAVHSFMARREPLFYPD